MINNFSPSLQSDKREVGPDDSKESEKEEKQSAIHYSESNWQDELLFKTAASTGLPSSSEPRLQADEDLSHSVHGLEEMINIHISGSQSAPVTFGLGVYPAKKERRRILPSVRERALEASLLLNTGLERQRWQVRGRRTDENLQPCRVPRREIRSQRAEGAVIRLRPAAGIRMPSIRS